MKIENNITAMNNVKKYLKEKGIPIKNLKSKELFLFAVQKRKEERDFLFGLRKKAKQEGKKALADECDLRLSLEFWDFRFFLSEGIQEYEYLEHKELLETFTKHLSIQEKFIGSNFFDYFGQFIDVYDLYCTLKLGSEKKNLPKKTISEIFKDIKIYFVDEERNIVEKSAIEEFFLKCIYTEQNFQREARILKEFWKK